jgi:DNA replication regulator SLD3
VQITATPKANRRQDMFTAAHRSNVPLVMEDAETSAIPPSSLPRIPQSVTRPSSEDQAKNPLFAIQATPTRKSTSVARGGKGFLDVTAAESSYQPLTPLQPGRSSKQLFNLGQETVVPQSSWSSQGVQETPAKQKSEAMLVHGHPILSTPISGKENLVSKGVVNCGMEQEPRKIGDDCIYKALGWDDADDIDDLA